MSVTATGGAEAAAPNDASHGHAHGSLAKLAVGAVGIVFGDIGTSPIYAFRETFAGHHTLRVDQMHVYGVLPGLPEAGRAFRRAVAWLS